MKKVGMVAQVVVSFRACPIGTKTPLSVQVEGGAYHMLSALLL